VRVEASDLYYEELGEGVPILLIHAGGATASTWGRAVDDLAQVGRVITYDRRGYERSGGEAVHSIPTHTADAAALLDALGASPAVAVGISVSATIAIDLALRHPDLVRAVVAHESPRRVTRQPPTVGQLTALSRMGWLAAGAGTPTPSRRFFASPTATATAGRRGTRSPRSGAAPLPRTRWRRSPTFVSQSGATHLRMNSPRSSDRCSVRTVRGATSHWCAWPVPWPD
jgi:pimeloyl-ACP methyl ester carboxylesterase